MAFHHDVLLLLALLGCGSPPATRVVDNSLNVTVYTDGQPGEPPKGIDPEDPRALVSQEKLTELLGHPLAFELDAAIAAKFGEGLHAAYVAALEGAAQGLTDCQKREPMAFRYGAGRLRTIRLSYTAVRSREPEVTLTDATLVISVSSNRSDLLSGSVLCPAFRRGLAADSEQRFATLAPEDVPPNEHAAYLEHIESARTGSGASGEERLAALGRCRRFAVLAPHLKDPTLRERVNDRLASCGSTLYDTLRAPPTDPVSSQAVDETHAAWMRWLNEHMGELGAGDQARLWMRLQTRRDPASARFRAGFDAPRFGVPVIEAWRKKTFSNGPRDWSSELERRVVAPAQGGARWLLSFEGNGRGGTYSDLARTPDGRRRLTKLLQGWRSEILTETAVLHTLRDEGAPMALALLDTLASDAALAHVGLRALAQYNEWAEKPRPSADAAALDPAALVAAAPGWWRQHPEHRAVYLYLLARIGEHREGVVPWSGLAKLLGARIDAPTLDAFLALDPGNIWYVSQLSAALGAGWPRAPALTRGLDAFLEASTNGKISRRVGDLLERVVAAVCDGRSAADVEQLRVFAGERVEIYHQPHIAVYLRSVKQTPAARLCPAFGRDKKGSEAVVFED